MCPRCLGEFSVMWVTKLMIFQVKKRIFSPKTTKFGPKMAFLFFLGQAMQAYSVPCWWVGWWLWRAGCISQDTYLLYMICVCFSGCSSRTRTWITTSRSRSQAMLSPPQSRREATKGLKPTLPPGVSFIHLIALSCHSFPHILSSCPPCTFPPCS